mgnify:FL=1|tara:strand:+ start:3422 stop:5236 length:1815 start_codon:yes stop_codon:yes gene_type:complete
MHLDRVMRLSSRSGDPAGSSIDHRPYVYVALFALLVIAVVLRGYGLRQLGLFTHDPATYATEGAAVALTAQWLVGHASSLLTGDANVSELVDFIREGGGTLPRFGKPGYALVVAVAYVLFGIHDYIYLGISVVLGTMLVGLVFLLGRTFYDERVGLAGAAFMAVSQYSVVFSRNGMAEICSAFLIFCGTYIYLLHYKQNARSSWLYGASALVLGFAFTANYKIFVVPALFVLYELCLLFARYRGGQRLKLGSVGLFMLLMAVPTVLMEMPYRLVSWSVDIASLSGDSTFITYFDQLAHRFTGGPNAYPATLGASLLQYPQAFWFVEGSLFCVAVVIGTGLLLRKPAGDRRLADVVILSQFIVPLALWSLFTGGRASLKPTVVILPAAAILAGVGLATVAQIVRLRKGKGALLKNVSYGLLLAVVVAYGSWRVAPVLTARSAFGPMIQRLAEHINRQGGTVTGHADSIGPILKFYLGALAREDRAGFGEQVDFTGNRDLHGDYAFVIGRPRAESGEMPRPWRMGDADYRSVSDRRPALVVDNLMYRYPAMLYTNYPAIKTRLKPVDTMIQVYDLRTGPGHNSMSDDTEQVVPDPALQRVKPLSDS